MAEVAREKGWTHSCQTPNQKRRCTCAGKGGNGWSYLDCTCKRAPTWDYIRFGENEKRDVEGVMMHSKYTGKFAEGQWGGGEFACNALYYSLEHKMIFDFTGGWAARDAERKRLRIPVFPQMAQANPDHDEGWQQRKWCEEGTELIYRYLKFRARKYTSGSAMMELRLWRILIDAVGTEEGFIELATTLADCGLESESSIEAKCVSAA